MATPLPPVLNNIKAQLIHTLGGDTNVENILHFALPPASFPLTPGNATSLANSVMTAWANNMAAVLATAISLTNVNVTDLNTATGVAQGSSHAAVPGTVATAPVPAGVSGVMKLGTALRGKSFRGRVFIAGIPQADTLTPQTWAAANITAISTAFTNFIAAMNALAAPGPATLTVVSYFQGKQANPNLNSRNRFIPVRRSPNGLATIVTSNGLSPILASQRRRNLQSR